jgi:hypothetical protein
MVTYLQIHKRVGILSKRMGILNKMVSFLKSELDQNSSVSPTIMRATQIASNSLSRALGRNLVCQLVDSMLVHKCALRRVFDFIEYLAPVCHNYNNCCYNHVSMALL